jgi:hypothetical protein
MDEPITSCGAWVTDFLRYHVLIRVFDGDANAWLAVIDDKSIPDGERIFVQWIADHLQRDSHLVDQLREVVEGSGLWPSALERGDRSNSAH